MISANELFGLAPLEAGGKDEAHEAARHDSKYGGGEGHAFAGINDGASIAEGLQGGFDDAVGWNFEDVLSAAVDVFLAGAAGVVAEVGGRRPGADGGDLDVPRGEFDGQRFGQAGDVGFGGGVDSEIGDGNGSGKGTDVEDGGGSLGSGTDVVEKRAGEQGQRSDVEVDLAADAVAAGVGKEAIVAEAGVVDKQVGLGRKLGDVLPEGFATGIGGEVAGTDDQFEMGVLLGEFGGEGLHGFFRPGSEQQGIGLRGELSGELGTESGGGSGDEGDAVFEGKAANKGLVSIGG